MKKSILFLFACIPLFASCNQNSNGFVNPFPNDPYESRKIGFNLAIDEKIKRVLSTKESELLDNTLKPATLDYINQNLITYETGEIYERDYTRAFAGVFGEGYTSSNIMHNETFESFYQPAFSEANPDPDLKERKKTVSNIESTYDYAYGQNTTTTNVKTLRYLAEEGSDSTHYVEWIAGDYSKESPTHTIERKYEIVDPEDFSKDIPISASIVTSEASELHKALFVNQSDYIFKPTSSDPVAGAYDDNHIIVIHEQHNPSDDYVLPDGRSYKMAINSLRVTSLVKKTSEILDPSNDEPTTIDYYLVERSRVYTEKAITSDVIHPNVPITFLKNPIVINYKEEIHKFFIDEITKKSEETINEVEIK